MGGVSRTISKLMVETGGGSPLGGLPEGLIAGISRDMDGILDATKGMPGISGALSSMLGNRPAGLDALMQPGGLQGLQGVLDQLSQVVGTPSAGLGLATGMSSPAPPDLGAKVAELSTKVTRLMELVARILSVKILLAQLEAELDELTNAARSTPPAASEVGQAISKASVLMNDMRTDLHQQHIVEVSPEPKREIQQALQMLDTISQILRSQDDMAKKAAQNMR